MPVGGDVFGYIAYPCRRVGVRKSKKKVFKGSKAAQKASRR